MVLKKLFSNEKGVTPVVGVMLMVVVTVILAAAVSSYAASMKSQDVAPQATLKTSASVADGYVKMEHLGGDILALESMSIEITYGTTGGFANMSLVTVEPANEFIRPGDVAKLSFNPVPGGAGADFKGDEINTYVYVGTPFKMAIIDKNSGQTIYSTTVTLNP